MAWITPEEVEAVYPSAELTEAQLAHVQGQAEGCVGPQTEPVSSALKAVVIDIAFRFWRGLQAAATNPAGYQSEQSPEYSYENPAAGPLLSGFGVTDRECRLLKAAAGYTGLSVQRVSRGVVETPVVSRRWDEPDFDVV